MGQFPAQRERAAALIACSAVIAGMISADKIVVKTVDEAFGVPRPEINAVISSKESRGKAFFMVDGDLHHNLAAAGSFGAAFRANFLQRNLSRPEAAVIKCSIAGPSCNPTDLLGIDVELPKPKVGDLIGVLKSGSYGFTASPYFSSGGRLPPS